MIFRGGMDEGSPPPSLVGEGFFPLQKLPSPHWILGSGLIFFFFAAFDSVCFFTSLFFSASTVASSLYLQASHQQSFPSKQQAWHWPAMPCTQITSSITPSPGKRHNLDQNPNAPLLQVEKTFCQLPYPTRQRPTG